MGAFRLFFILILFFIIATFSCNIRRSYQFNIRLVLFERSIGLREAQYLYFAVDHPGKHLPDSIQKALDAYICKYLDTVKIDERGMVINVYKESESLKNGTIPYYSSRHNLFAQYVWNKKGFNCKFDENKIPFSWDIGCFKNPIDSVKKRKILEFYH